MTSRGDDSAERRALTDAMARLLRSPRTGSRGAMSVSHLAREAGCGRHLLTHKHVDLQDLWTTITSQLADTSSNATTGGDDGSQLEDLKDEVKSLRDINTSLTAHLAAAVLRIEELERSSRRGRTTHLRTID